MAVVEKIQHPSGVPFRPVYEALLRVGRVKLLSNNVILIQAKTCFNHWELTSLFSIGSRYGHNRPEVPPYQTWYQYLHDAFGFGGVAGWHAIQRHRRLVQMQHAESTRRTQDRVMLHRAAIAARARESAIRDHAATATEKREE